MRTTIHILLTVALVALCLEAVAQKMPERRWVRRGNESFSNGRYDESIEHYQKAVEKAPNSYEARYNLASAYVQAERYDRGEELLRELLADSLNLSNNRIKELYYNLGNTQFAKRNYAEACNSYNKVIERDSTNFEAFYNRGNALFAQDKLEEALKSYKHALRINPKDEDARFNYAYTRNLLKKPQPPQGQQGQQNQQDNDQNQQNQSNSGGQNNQQDNQKSGDKQNGQDKSQDKDKNDKQDNKQQKGDGKDGPQDDKGKPQPDNKDGKSSDNPDSKPNGPDNSDTKPNNPDRQPTQQQKQMLDMIQAMEDKTRDKLNDKKKAAGAVRIEKNW